MALAAIWVLIIAGSILRGELSSSLGALDEAVASGQVHAVQVVGALPTGAKGSAAVELHWRDGLIRRVAEVRQATSDDPVMQSPVENGQDPIIVGDVASHLSSTHPGLQVSSEPNTFLRSGITASVLGWRVSGWIAITLLIAWLATLVLLITGPLPWRATRWAWFWIMANSPLGVIGVLAFLLLSGPTPPLPGPKAGRRRLRGGWAFIIATLVTGAMWRL